LVQKLLLSEDVFNARFVRIAIWLLAMILPGGLVLLAVWESQRSLRARNALRASTPPPHLPPPGQQPLGA